MALACVCPVCALRVVRCMLCVYVRCVPVRVAPVYARRVCPVRALAHGPVYAPGVWSLCMPWRVPPVYVRRVAPVYAPVCVLGVYALAVWPDALSGGGLCQKTVAEDCETQNFFHFRFSVSFFDGAFHRSSDGGRAVSELFCHQNRAGSRHHRGLYAWFHNPDLRYENRDAT